MLFRFLTKSLLARQGVVVPLTAASTINVL